MDFKDCIKFANDNPVSFIATESDFYYYTGTAKSVYKQLKNNPNVEICFYHACGRNDGQEYDACDW